MDNNTNHTTAAAAGEKKNSVKALLEKGKSTGKLTTQEIDAAIVEEDFDMEELDKLYETIESMNIEIIDDFGDVELDNLNCLRVKMPLRQQVPIRIILPWMIRSRCILRK